MELNHIPFNKPYLSGKETHYIYQAVYSGKLSGNGAFTKKCQRFFEEKYNLKKCFLTSSCTDALEMAALLCELETGDEIILPSYTFVSSANAFVLRGATVKFCDSLNNHPGIDEDQIEALITERTKVIVVVHYAGVACDMDKIMSIAKRYNLLVVEDAAHAIDSYFISSNGTKMPLGSIGHFSTFSFHETKNIISGEGGLLAVNDDRFIERAEIIWEKGTNRSAFWRGEVDKYNWMDIGSSFLPSEITAAFLWAQLEDMKTIQQKRKFLWEYYFNRLSELKLDKHFKLPVVPNYATNNGHLFYILLPNEHERNNLIQFLKEQNINAVFHYLPLHNSPYFESKHDNRTLNQCSMFSKNLVRLPLFFELSTIDIDRIVVAIEKFYN